MAGGGGSLVDDLLPLISTLAYPVDLEDPLSELEPDVSNLSDLAAVQIVSDPLFLAAVFHLRLLPNSLYPTLLRASLLYGYDTSLRFLIRNWPFPYIRLREVLRLPLLRTPLAIVYYETALSRLKVGIRLTTSMVRALLDCLADLSTTNLQFIDLSGFPTAEVVACYAAVQCQLVNTDVQRQEMVKNFNELVSMMKSDDDLEKELLEGETGAEEEDHHGAGANGGGEEKAQHPKEYEVLDEKFRQPCSLVFDLTLSHSHRVDDVMHALVWSKTPACRFRLVMSALNLQGLGFDIIARILECTIKSELQCLDVAYNALAGQTVVLLASLNSSFVNLAKLDLSNNSMNLSSLSNRAESAQFFASSLASLPNLRHLSLSKNRLTCSLSTILSQLANQLITLRVAGCALRGEDLQYLASSQHAQRYLDLSENNLGDQSCWCHVIALLKDRGSRLYSLELSRSFIGDDELGEIVKQGGAATWFRALRYLSLSRNIIVTRFLRTLVQSFTFEAPRCVLCLPCPFDCRERDPAEDDAEAGTAALDGSNVEHDLAAHGAIKMLAPKNVRIVFSGQAF